MVLLKLYNHQPLLLLHRLSFKSKGSDNASTKAPGLPNITGTWRGSADNRTTEATGAMYLYGNVYYYNDAWSQMTGGIGFDASRLNSIYGSSETVQPPTLALIPQIKY